MSNHAPSTANLPTAGIGFAVSCYLVWGLVPVYWKGIIDISAAEALIPRILWTLIILWIAAIVTRRTRETWARGRREWGWTTVSALLLSGNWCLFVYAVGSDQVVASSLGYYINPLMSILLGLIVLGERLGRIQSVAIGIAALGVGVLTFRVGELPWISLVLATSFALYGLIHKLHPRPPLAGLTREMLVLSPAALLGLGFLLWEPNSAFAAASIGEHAYLALSGAVTAIPLLLFHAATRHLPLVAVGMFQYIAPTLTLILATFAFHEPFTSAHAAGFGLVWIGLAIFSSDSILRARAASGETNSATDDSADTESSLA
jgi:chloramphenicol-sensitive protein RarD